MDRSDDDVIRELPGQLALGIRNRKREGLVRSLRSQRAFFESRITEIDHALELLGAPSSEDLQQAG